MDGDLKMVGVFEDRGFFENGRVFEKLEFLYEVEVFYF